MRRPSTIHAIIFVLALTVALAILGSGCGTGVQTAGLSPDDLSPEGILAKAVLASEEMTSARGSFDVQISIDADLAQLPEEEKALLARPMEIYGTLAYSSDSQAGEFTVGFSAAGAVMDVGVKLLDDEAWIRFMEEWYEAPPEMLQLLTQSAESGATLDDMGQLLGDLGVDPATWLNDLRLVGEETLEGTEAYHLSASPDLARMMADMLELMESGELMNLLDPTGSAGDLMGSSPSLPGADELQEMQEQLEAMFRDLTADLWVAKDGFTVLKLSLEARIVPPPGEDAGGLAAVNLSAMVSLHDVNEPVVVEPPTAAQPWSALEKALEENPGLFMGPFFGSALGGMPAAPESYQ